MAKSKGKSSVPNPEKLVAPARAYVDDIEVAEIALKDDPEALANAKIYLNRRLADVGSVDRERGHWFALNAEGPINDVERARQKVRDWLIRLLMKEDGTKKIRKSVAAVMLGMSQPKYDAELRRLKDENAKKAEGMRDLIPLRPGLATPLAGQSARHGRAQVFIEEVRLIKRFIEKDKGSKQGELLDKTLPPATSVPKPRRLAPDPVDRAAADPALNHPLVIEARAVRGLISGQLEAGRYYLSKVTNDGRIVQTEVMITSIPEREIVAFLTSGSDLEYLTIHESLTKREWSIEAEMGRWVDCFIVLARRMQDANTALLGAAKQAASESDVAAVDALDTTIAIENRNLDVRMAEVNAAHFQRLLPVGPKKTHVPF